MMTITFALDSGKFEQFMIHKDLPFKRSEFFRKTTNAAAAINSKGISPHHFKVYVDWLYTQRTNIVALLRGTYNSKGDPTEFDLLRERYIGRTLCDLWIIGGILGDTKFQNEIMDSLFNFEYFKEEKADVEVVKLIVQRTSAGPKLQSWLAHHLHGMRKFEFNSIKHLLDAEMLNLILRHESRFAAAS